MELKDLIITPIYIILFTILSYFLRPYLTNSRTRKYFLPALCIRFAGAIFLGLIYQFYYSGGDTYNYYNQATIIHNAFLDKPIYGFHLLLNSDSPDLFNYISRIRWYSAPSEYFVVRLVSIISIFSFNSYCAIALFFAVFSFFGVWALYSSLEKRYPNVSGKIALAVLFFPSVVFWGSGILKDSLTLGALGILFWSFDHIIERKGAALSYSILAFLSAYILYKIKIYVLLCFIPVVFLWFYMKRVKVIKNGVVRILVIPVLAAFILSFGYLILNQVASSSERYNLDSIAERSYITAYDIRYVTGAGAGSGYDIGAQDGTWQTLLKLAPAAINVTLFRPYLWEVNNPLMLLSSLEALFLTLFTLKIFFSRKYYRGGNILGDRVVKVLLIFSIAFAFAVGVSSYNFGTLNRYKIPLIPFYTSALFILSRNQNLT